MAQPSEKSEGAPRKTTTHKEFEGMNSQDERYGCEKTEFFWLENVMRTADGLLRSVPGPTAVLATFIGGGGGGFLLLETGDHVLLEDGGRIILNG
jgi:hypothetical protein